MVATPAAIDEPPAHLVRDLNLGFTYNYYDATSGYRQFISFGGITYFQGCDDAEGCELWKTDGTAEGTAVVADLSPGPASSYPRWFVEYKGALYFIAQGPTNAASLWKTDGTAPGTVIVTADAKFTYVSGGFLYYSNGEFLWQSDGTAEATVVFQDSPARGEDCGIGGSSVINGVLYYTIAGAERCSTWGVVYFLELSTGRTGQINDVQDWVWPVGQSLYYGAEDQYDGTPEGLWKFDGFGTSPYQVSTVQPEDYNPIADYNGIAILSADDGTSGYELWRSDGTATGTFPLKDIAPGPASSWVDEFFNAAGLMFFTADDGDHGRELWRTDGTPEGTFLLRDINPGPASPRLSRLIRADGRVFFTADDGTHGVELWTSDGTPDGTQLVRDLAPGSDSSRLDLTAVTAGILYFVRQSEAGNELWRSDGTSEGTIRVTPLLLRSGGSYPGAFTPLNGSTYFLAYDSPKGSRLWKTDGTTAGTEPVYDNSGSVGPLSPAHLTRVGDRFYFTAYDPAHGRDLWTSDGTEIGTTRLKDFWPGDPLPYDWLSLELNWPLDLTGMNGTLFFTAYDPSSGRELWKSDGTPDGTVLVKDILPGSDSGMSYYARDERGDNLVDVGGLLFFFASGTPVGRQLWRSDGTPEGTTLVKDVQPGDPALLTNVDGTLFFFGNDPAHGSELWKSDGTGAGTVLVKDIRPGSADSIVFYSDMPKPVAFKGRLYFGADDGSGNGQVLWTSDGSSAGTQPVMTAGSLPLAIGWSPPTLYVGGDLLYVIGYVDGVNGIWATDGTDAWFVRAMDVNPYAFQAVPEIGGALFGGTSAGGTCSGLWITDGTRSGTRFLQDLPAFMAGRVGDLIYLSADDGIRGYEPWVMSVSDLVQYSAGHDLPICDDAPANPPVVTLSVSPASITAGESVTITWETTGATLCFATGGWSGLRWITGTETIVVDTAGPQSYTLTCDGPGGSTSSAIALSAAPETLTLTVAPASIAIGDTATLTWNYTGASLCVAGGAWFGTKGPSGSRTVGPFSDTGVLTYRLQCGTAQSAVQLQVANSAGGSSGAGGSGALDGRMLGLLLLAGLSRRRYVIGLRASESPRRAPHPAFPA